MSLTYKPDWEETKQRYLQWWNHEYFGRCALAVFAPKADPPPLPDPPKAKTIEEKWYDLDLISATQRYHLSRTFYGGEALPIWNGGYPGHTAIPSFLGCPTVLDWNTGWWEPILTGEDIDVRDLHLQKNSRNYRFAHDLLRRGVQEMQGHGLVATGAFGGCGDTLAALRGTEQLLVDCLERPDQVKTAERWLMDQWFEVFDSFHAITQAANDGGSTGWFDLWSPGRFYAASNDFAYSISPRLFREIFLPEIRRQTEFLTHTVYHVDGEGNFTHVDALLELPRLQALQILPGAGKPSPLHYLNLLKKVQQAGRNLHICLSPGEVRQALELLSARGLFIQTWCDTEVQARELLDQVKIWSHDRG
ncbi:MAG: hypothetical protein HZA50_10520 [Planctomycetes bacterium]|nr:hypothetical protein [Planctomycetota bacterium]